VKPWTKSELIRLTHNLIQSIYECDREEKSKNYISRTFIPDAVGTLAFWHVFGLKIYM
jgi:hypothetical protein